jgi:hypothetical protein
MDSFIHLADNRKMKQAQKSRPNRSVLRDGGSNVHEVVCGKKAPTLAGVFIIKITCCTHISPK